MSIDLNAYRRQPGAKTSPTEDARKIGRKFPEKRKEAFYKELAMLLQSGVDFKKSLEILITQTKNQKEKAVITEILEMVVEGNSIWEAMRETGMFSPYEYYSIQIGEESRKLEPVLEELNKFLIRKIQMRRQIISVLTYPSIVMAVTILVLYFMLNNVVPMFGSVFKQFGSELPAMTRYIIAISNRSGILFLLLFIFVASIVTFHYFNKNRQSYRDITSKLILRLPFFGSLIRQIYLSRFCQAMGLLTSSKTSLMMSLDLTGKMIGFYPLEKSIEGIKHDVIHGSSLSESMKKYSIYENKMVSMIDVAEQVNQLDSMFERLTEQYNETINHKTKMIGVVLEPMIIIIIGVIVGIIMVSMYAPMFELSKIIKV